MSLFYYIFFSEINECFSIVDICNGHGQCINTVGSYQCICDAGWTGQNCSIGKYWIIPLTQLHRGDEMRYNSSKV